MASAARVAASTRPRRPCECKIRIAALGEGRRRINGLHVQIRRSFPHGLLAEGLFSLKTLHFTALNPKPQAL